MYVCLNRSKNEHFFKLKMVLDVYAIQSPLCSIIGQN
jgi:hypothetical protein